jgi:hypothetical protein
MPIASALLPEFDQEIATTRRVIERVPEARADWSPHPKSWPMGSLAVHCCNLLVWTVPTLTETELDVNPPGGPPWTPPRFTTTTAALELLDTNARAAREAIAACSDAAFQVPWTLKNAGRALFTLPRAAVLRAFVFSHLIHHRGQLTVYLRMNDVPLPSVYGPTADEAGGM